MHLKKTYDFDFVLIKQPITLPVSEIVFKFFWLNTEKAGCLNRMLIENVLKIDNDNFTLKVLPGLKKFSNSDIRNLTRTHESYFWELPEINDLPFYSQIVGDFVTFVVINSVKVSIKSNGLVKITQLSNLSSLINVINAIKPLKLYNSIVLIESIVEFEMDLKITHGMMVSFLAPLMFKTLSMRTFLNYHYNKTMKRIVGFMTLLQTRIKRLNSKNTLRKLPLDLLRYLGEFLLKFERLKPDVINLC